MGIALDIGQEPRAGKGPILCCGLRAGGRGRVSGNFFTACGISTLAPSFVTRIPRTHPPQPTHSRHAQPTPTHSLLLEPMSVVPPDPLSTHQALEIVARSTPKVHRVPMVSATGQLKRIISQSSIIHFVHTVRASRALWDAMGYRVRVSTGAKSCRPDPLSSSVNRSWPTSNLVCPPLLRLPPPPTPAPPWSLALPPCRTLLCSAPFCPAPFPCGRPW